MSVIPFTKSITMQSIVAETLKDKSNNLDNFQLSGYKHSNQIYKISQCTN